MKLATLRNGGPDGALVVVSSDNSRILPVGHAAPSLLEVMATWADAEALLRQAAERVEAGEGEPTDEAEIGAPLPRSWQWLDGSAFPTHADLMQTAFGMDLIESDRPLMYQGLSDRFYGPRDVIRLPGVEDGIDFEGEFGVIVDMVPMGCTPARALGHIKLIVQINDWSLRRLASIEMKTGFGWVQAKPACSMAPFAVTPDELGSAWRDGRVGLDLHVALNGEWFGHPNGGEMAFGFHELVAHAAATRDLVAGTVIGSGTVSNADHATVGSSCIAERRAIEIIAQGEPATPFMAFGDTVAMMAKDAAGRLPFGAILQQVGPS